MSNEISKCCTCGYEWRTGQDGSHTCSATLLKIIDDNQSRIAALEAVMEKARMLADTPRQDEIYLLLSEALEK